MVTLPMPLHSAFATFPFRDGCQTIGCFIFQELALAPNTYKLCEGLNCLHASPRTHKALKGAAVSNLVWELRR
jgi:hypothetical protein